MAATARQFKVVFNGDSSGLEKTLGKIGSSLGSVAKIAAGFTLGALTTQLPNALNGLANGYAALELNANKAKVVFEDSLGTVQKWASENASAMGMTERQVTTLAASMADLLKPMGFTAAQAATMSTEITGLAGALSQWSGNTKSSAEVADILQKALLGETDGLKSLGIAISAADVEARLAAKGQRELTGAVRQQAEAVAIQEMIFEKSTDAQKAWADGGSKTARAANEMRAAKERLKETLTIGLGPAITKGTTLLAEGLVPALEKVGEWANKAGPVLASAWSEHLQPAIASFVEWATPRLQQFGTFVAEEVFPRIVEGARALGTFWKEDLQPAISAFVEWVMPYLQEFGAFVASEFRKFQGYYETDLKPAFENIKIGFQGLVTAFEAVIAWVREHWPEIQRIIEPVINQIILAIRTMYETVKLTVGIIVDLIGGDFSGAWDKAKEIVELAVNYIEGTLRNFLTLTGRILAELGPLLWNLFNAALDKAKEALDAGLSALTDWFRSLPGLLLAALGDVSQLLVDAGKAIAQSLLDGLVEGAKAVWREVASWGGKIKNLKGPLEADRKLLQPEGYAVALSLGDGLESGFRVVAGLVGAWAVRIQRLVGGVIGGGGGGGSAVMPGLAIGGLERLFTAEAEAARAAWQRQADLWAQGNAPMQPGEPAAPPMQFDSFGNAIPVYTETRPSVAPPNDTVGGTELHVHLQGPVYGGRAGLQELLRQLVAEGRRAGLNLVVDA